MDIYAIGDITFIAQSLNGVAMMMNTDTIGSIAQLGGVIGVLLVAVGALMNQQLNLQYLLIGWIVVIALLVPRTDVVVLDYDTGEAIPVADIPLGIAMSASVLSTMGLRLTELYETALATPSMSAFGGFLDPVKTLLSLRDASLGKAARLGQPAADNTTDLSKTISQYVADCTLYAIDLGFKSDQEILKAANTFEAIRVDSDIWATKTWLPGDPVDGSTVTCTQAYAAIDAQLDGGNAAFWTPWNAHLSSEMKKSGIVPQDEVDNAISALGALGFNAQTFMLNVLIWDMLAEGTQLKYATEGNVAASAMLASAREARNVEMAAEGSMFKRYVEPTATFIEVFVFVMAPFLAFFAMLGRWGIRFFGTFLGLIAWVQLWPPIMAIVNSYTMWVIRDSVDSRVTDESISFGSIEHMENLYPMLSDWLGTAGMMMAATSSFALLLIYGGAYTAVNLASRMHARDNVNEGMVAPPVMRNSSALATPSYHTNSPSAGVNVAGYDKLAGQVAVSSVLGSSTASGRSSSIGFTQSESATLNSMMQSGLQHNLQNRSGSSVAESIRTSGSELDKTIMNHANRATQGVQNQEVFRDGASVAIAGAMGSGNTSAPSIKKSILGVVSGSLQGKMSNEEITQTASTIAGELSDTLTSDKSFSRDTTRAFGHDIQHGHSNSATTSDTAQESRGLRETFEKRQDARDSFNETATAATQATSSVQMTRPEQGKKFLEQTKAGAPSMWNQALDELSPGAKQELTEIDRTLSKDGRAFMSMPGEQGITNETPEQRRRNGVNARHEVAASIYNERSIARGHDGEGNPINWGLAQNLADRVEAMGIAGPEGDVNPHRNADVSPGTRQAVEEQTASVHSGVESAGDLNRADVESAVQATTAASEGVIADAPQELESRQSSAKGQQRQAQRAFFEQHHGKVSPMFEELQSRAVEDTSGSINTIQEISNALGNIGDVLSNPSDLGHGNRKEALAEKYDEAVNAGGGHVAAMYYATTQVHGAETTQATIAATPDLGDGIKEFDQLPEAEMIRENGIAGIRNLAFTNQAHDERQTSSSSDIPNISDGVTGINPYSNEPVSGWRFGAHEDNGEVDLNDNLNSIDPSRVREASENLSDEPLTIEITTPYNPDKRR